MEVSKSGVLIYSFRPGFDRSCQIKGLRAVANRLISWVARAAWWLLKISFGLGLIVCVVIVVVLLFLAIAAASGSSKSSGGRSSSSDSSSSFDFLNLFLWSSSGSGGSSTGGYARSAAFLA